VGPWLKSDIASPIPKAHFETVLNMSPDVFATEAMGMRHCLPGKLSVSLREADSSRLRHIAAGTHDLGDHSRASISLRAVWLLDTRL